MKRTRSRHTLSSLMAALLAGCGGGSSGSAGPSLPPPSTPTIGAEGGTVSGALARLEVPRNALASPAPLAIRGTTAVPLDPYAVVGGSVEVGPAGTAFLAPATLVLSYSSGQPPLGIDERELRLHVLEGGEWRLLPGGGVDAGAREVRAPIQSAGTFAARWVVGPSAACSGAEARQFDFWLGDWDLQVQSGGSAGTNRIVRKGCVLEEEFHSAAGPIGRSVSFRNAGDRSWYQTYLDGSGNRLPLRGALAGRDMVLYHEPGRNGRSTWQPLDADRVRFYQEALTGGAWRIAFDSTYVRR